MRSTVWSFLLLVFVVGLFSAAFSALIVWTSGKAQKGGFFLPEIELPLVLVGGLIALVIALATLVAAFHLFKLTNKERAFGVPEGTLQAVIALTLILIFAISSLYLRGSLDSRQATINGLTADQVKEIPGDQILSNTPTTTGTTTTYTVVRLIPPSSDARDFSKQLLTILGTLVGAIAGFYFGAKSVETGVSAGTTNVPPTNTAPPSVTGTGRVGDILRADVGGWTGSPPPNYGHQWQRQPAGTADWTDIDGANAPSYQISPVDTGATLRVAVTATNSAGAITAFSPATDVIVRSPTAISPPRIEGGVRENETLTADPGDWEASPPATFTWLWQRAPLDEDAWQPIRGAEAASYQAAREDVGRRLRVQVTATNSAGTGGPSLSAPTEPIAGRAINMVPPAITGEPLEGETLMGDKGQWSGWPLTYTYQWEHAGPSGTEYLPIDGSRDPTYALGRSDVGTRIRVSVAVDGISIPSNGTDPVKGAPVFESSPTVSGTPRVGHTLHAETTELTAWPAANVTHQWQRQTADGNWQDIPGENTDSYTIDPADTGLRLRVAVIATNELQSTTAWSNATDPVTAPEAGT